MKIIEALKELGLTEKKITKQIDEINKYASELSIGGAMTFKTEDAQRQEVDSRLQSVRDLVTRRGQIRRLLAITNAAVPVTIEGVVKTITEWIEYRQHGAEFLTRSLNALNDNTAQRALQSTGQRVDVLQGVKVIRFYDEADKNKRLAEVAQIKDRIDATLEIVNATTEIQGLGSNGASGIEHLVT